MTAGTSSNETSPQNAIVSPEYQQLLTIDNKGKGDCAFLSFVIGLIALAQKELSKRRTSPNSPTPIYDKLKELIVSSKIIKNKKHLKKL